MGLGSPDHPVACFVLALSASPDSEAEFTGFHYHFDVRE